eukprot:2228002-Lingulodinium_polyedra.AAC.1
MARCRAQAAQRLAKGPSSAEVRARVRLLCPTATGWVPRAARRGRRRPSEGPDGSARMPGGRGAVRPPCAGPFCAPRP